MSDDQKTATGAYPSPDTTEALLDDLHRALHRLMQQEACSPNFCLVREDARRIMREATERGLALRARREACASDDYPASVGSDD